MIHAFYIEVEVDELNPNTPTKDIIRMTLEDSITTPDNDHFGIKRIKVSDLDMNPNKIREFFGL